ncbi:MAG: recombinase family protein, partial [Hyphomonadaceae bacterium]|nr:recombinase family protein [Hyphomonadaceae bacterium]
DRASSGRRAAQYLRMSTEHQRYSTQHQAETIARYAAEEGMELVATYTDAGISGIGIKNRHALRQLLADVLGGSPGFDTILVHDVSRWGRFQNPDQSAHYEFLCAEAGVKVEYCAELFANDGSLSSTILKGLKRAMAAEYSRELSVKVSAAKTGLLKQGFWQGGRAGYGLRRQMIAPDGRPERLLQYGEFKGVQGHRTILVPGPPTEIAIVQRIYRMFTVAGLRRPTIARILNAEGVLSESGRPWTFNTVHGVLVNPKYTGDLVGNRSKGFLDAPRTRNAAATWVRVPGAFEPIISRRLFEAAALVLDAQRPVELTREQMVVALQQLFKRHGKLTGRVIDDTPGLPCSGRFRAAFGGAQGLYEAIGRLTPHPRRYRDKISDDQVLERLARLLATTGHLSKAIIATDPAIPSPTSVARRFGSLAKAFARVGFVTLSHKARGTLVGRARIRAALTRSLMARGLLED